MDRKVILSVSLIIILLLAFFSIYAGEQVKIGKKLSDFSLTDENGKKHTLSNYYGKVVVLEWINPDCPFVQRHYKEGTMKRFAERFKEKGVVWIAINTTNYNKPKDSKKWSKKYKLPYSTLIDSDGKVGKMFGAKTTPHMFVIDANGKLLYNGAIDDDPQGIKSPDKRNQYVATAIKAVLQGKEPEITETKPYGCSVKYAAK